MGSNVYQFADSIQPANNPGGSHNFQASSALKSGCVNINLMNLQKELEHRKYMNEDIPAIQESEEMIETFRNDEHAGSLIP